MKRAKVSAVYEGRLGYRNKEEEESDSRRARMHARARKYGSKARMRSHSFVLTGKPKRSRSNIKRKVEKDKEEQLCMVVSSKKEVCMAKDQAQTIEVEVINDVPKLDGEAILGPELGSQVLVQEVAMMSEQVVSEWGEGPVWWEEYWPMNYSYELEPLMGLGCFPDWELMHGFVDFVGEEQLWVDDIWNSRDINGFPIV